jgi:hypothetical protein
MAAGCIIDGKFCIIDGETIVRDDVCLYAISINRNDLLQKAVEHKCPIDKNVAKQAVKRGSIEALQYLLALGCPLDANVANMCATMGRIDMLDLLVEYRAPASYGLYVQTILFWKGGHVNKQLDILNWVYRTELSIKGKMPMYKDLPECAIEKGNLDVFSWLLEHNCPWDKVECMRIAKLYGNERVIRCLESIINPETPMGRGYLMRTILCGTDTKTLGVIQKT